MKNLYLAIPLLLLTSALTGCLVTRQEVREGVAGNSASPVRSTPLSTEQQRQTNIEVRSQEIDEQLRALTGRVETVENNVNIMNADKSGSKVEQQNEKKALRDKLAIYEEELGKLQTQQLAIAQQVEALRQGYDALAASSRESKSSNTKASSKGSFESAEGEYGKKRWKEAIVGFEKYRSANPNGRNYSQATFKIGASFHELGMKAEAKSFYSEVIEKYPKSEWAKKAQARLKTLK